nr:aldose 1-epimerase [uncultured Rhodopila sp.]
MLTLTAGESSIVVAPETGAGITGWMLGRTALTRRALPEATSGGDSHAMALFPLLPYCNRIGAARFAWQGVEYRLARNFGDNPHSIHGVGWQRAWTVVSVGPSAVTMVLEHRADPSWPFAFEAEVTYGLTASGLHIAMRLTNRHGFAAPAGMGIHPYFPKEHDPALRFNASGVWENGADALPQRHGPVPPEWQHAVFLAVAQSRLDNCFTGWDGRADIRAAAASLRIEASAVFRQLQVFTPHWADFFCVEPVTHVPDAVNRDDLPADQAMHVLAPDETLSGTISLTPGG